MENRFAGAQNQGERRRRRLSGDAEVVGIEAPQSGMEVANEESLATPMQETVLRRVISPRLWKSVLAILGIFASSMALLWAAPDDSTFSLSDVRENLTDRFAGLLLIVAGQYAVLIGWIRSLSEVDFKGRYRGWKWMGLTSCVSGVVLVLGVGGLLPELISALLEPLAGKIQAARPAIQLVCAATVSLIVLARVLPDMGRCLSSQVLLIGAILVTVVNVMLHHGAHSNVSIATFKALTLLAANGLFGSMLLHCRFVAFVNNDPPSVADADPKVQIEVDQEQQKSKDEAVAEKIAPKTKSQKTAKSTKPSGRRKKQPVRKAA